MTAMKVVSDPPFVEEAIRVLSDTGYRITVARSAILRCLAEADTPLSPVEVLKKIQNSKSRTSVDRVSVYRVLEVLLKNHLVHQIGPEGKYVRCAHINCISHNHVILRCTKCASTEEHHLPEKLLNPSFKYLRSSLGFSPTGHHFQIDGQCKRCSS